MRRAAQRIAGQLVLWGLLLGTSLAVACSGGGGGAYGSNDPGGVSTVISGQSDTSGVSAGSALRAPGAGGSGAAAPTATRMP
jgi:hypothetical protein